MIIHNMSFMPVQLYVAGVKKCTVVSMTLHKNSQKKFVFIRSC